MSYVKLLRYVELSQLKKKKNKSEYNRLSKRISLTLIMSLQWHFFLLIRLSIMLVAYEKCEDNPIHYCRAGTEGQF